MLTEVTGYTYKNYRLYRQELEVIEFNIILTGVTGYTYKGYRLYRRELEVIIEFNIILTGVCSQACSKTV